MSFASSNKSTSNFFFFRFTGKLILFIVISAYYDKYT